MTKSAVPAYFVIFTEEILNGKLHFLCSELQVTWNPGFLFSGMNQLAVNVYKLLWKILFVKCMFLMQSKFANDYGRTNEHEPNGLGTIILHKLPASNPDGIQRLFVFMAALITNSPSIAS